MSYLYALRWKMEENDLILALREVRETSLLFHFVLPYR